MNTKEVVVTGTEEIMLNPDQLTSRIDISELELSDYLTPGGYVSSVTSILTISPTLSTDSGNYSCIASNVVGRTMTPAQDEDTATLYIQGKLQHHKSCLVRVVHDNYAFTCNSHAKSGDC